MADDDAQYAFTVPPPGAETDAALEPSTSSSSSKPSKKRKVKDVAPAVAEEEAAPEAVAGEEEERPLSHKEKRLAKKRKLAAEAAAAAGGEADGGEGGASSAPAPVAKSNAAPAPTMIGGTLVGNTPARSAHGVWVGNLNFATHARELLAWFSERGLKEVTRINMPNGKRAHENNRGFAYLDFPSETDVTIAVALSEQHLDGRKLLIKNSSDYTGRPAPSASTSSSTTPAAVVHADESTLPPLDPSALDPSAPPAAPGAPQTLNRTARKILDRQKNPPGPTLFIGNLGFETKVEDVRDMFDRNQKRAAEWAPKEKGKKGEKSGKKPGVEKGKGKEKKEGGDDEDDEEEADTDRGEDDSDSDEEDGEGAKENGEGETKRDKKDKGKKGPLDLAQAKDAGIRKVRLGTFEDSGKCKGWCFVDFHLPAQATRALLNLRNHTLNGRKLNVEFASADAVRRGGLGSRAASKAAGRAKREGGGGYGRGEDGGEDGGRGRKRPRHDGGGGGGEWDDGAVRDLAASGGFSRDAPPRRGGFERDDGGRGKKGGVADGKRAKPGAALANAQRASEAIVQSTGRKTTFD